MEFQELVDVKDVKSLSIDELLERLNLLIIAQRDLGIFFGYNAGGRDHSIANAAIDRARAAYTERISELFQLVLK